MRIEEERVVQSNELYDIYPNVCTLTQEEVEANPFCDGDHRAAFYRMFTKKAYGMSWDDVKDLDCRKVIISPDIQESWYRNRPGDVSEVQLTMALAMSGPKAEHALPPLTVRWADDCISC